MKIKSLEMENFRQFYGVQRMGFSTDPERNVSLIYGSNGAGKTTILNAFTWGLYGSHTPGLAESDWLANNLAWSEVEPGAQLVVRVAIEFEDDAKTYEIERSQVALKSGDGELSMTTEPKAVLHITDESGRNELGNTEGAVTAILPERLHRFVFFDGERDIEHLAKPEATAEIRDAISTVLGLKVIERSIDHVGRARADLNRDLKAVGDDRDEELATKIEAVKEELTRARSDLNVAKANHEELGKDIESIDKELKLLEASRELQKRREELEGAVQREGQRISQSDRDLDQSVRRNGFLAFVTALVTSSEVLVDELYDKGQIPSAIKQPFVQSLIENQECICGTPLPEGSPEQAAVSSWFQKAGRPEVEDNWIHLGAHAKSFRSRRDELYLYLRETLAEREEHEASRKQWADKLSEIDEELRTVDSEQVRELESKRERLKRDRDQAVKKTGGLEQKISDLEAEQRGLETDIERAQGESQQAAVARRRIAVAREVTEVFSKILDVRAQQTRTDLDRSIKQVFGRLCFKPYVPALTEDFRLTLSTTVAGQELAVAKSTGESQILSLSFVGAMVDLAKRRYEQSKEKSDTAGLVSFRGGIFPVVLDAVFGTLDDTYQSEAAQVLPELSPQVIVLISRGQAPGPVKEKLWPRVGRVAVCTLYTSEPSAEAAEVEIPAGSVPYRVPISEDRTRTEIEEH